jgi:hypothetical protein
VALHGYFGISGFGVLGTAVVVVEVLGAEVVLDSAVVVMDVLGGGVGCGVGRAQR